jgi:hypothetical protein
MKNKFYKMTFLIFLFQVLIFNCNDPGNGTAAETYTVTYDGNGNIQGSVPADSNTYEEGDTVTVLDNSGGLALGDSENTFSSWNTAADGSGSEYTAGETLVIGSSDIILYARYEGLPSSYFQVRFTGDTDRQFGIGPDEDNIIIDSGIVAAGTTTGYFSGPAGDYNLYSFTDPDWFYNGDEIFEAQKKYKIIGSGLNSYNIEEE